MPQTQGKALLFDIDGTLADTDPLHLAAFNQVLGPHGHAFDRARFGNELQGFSNASIGERFLAHEPPERRAIILGEKERIFRELVSGRIVPVPGLMALFDRWCRRAHGGGDQRAAPERRTAALGIRHRAPLQGCRDR